MKTNMEGRFGLSATVNIARIESLRLKGLVSLTRELDGLVK
jgi:hypothetical protein